MSILYSLWVNRVGVVPLMLGICAYLVFSYRLPKSVRSFTSAAVAMVAVRILLYGSPFTIFAGDIVSNRSVGNPAGEVTDERHILFIGNSYTFYNDMPDMVARLAEADPENHQRFVIQLFAWGGANLNSLWNDGRALKLIQSKHWDDVVLQEQSYWAMFPQSVDVTSRYAQRFAEAIKEAGGRTVLFTTWARQPGSHFYRDSATSFLRNPVYMQEQFNLNTQRLADRLDAIAIPVGDNWATALAVWPDLPLYLEDGSHPSPTGSYLAALTFYRHFSGRSLNAIEYVPNDVLPEHAALLKTIVSRQSP